MTNKINAEELQVVKDFKTSVRLYKSEADHLATKLKLLEEQSKNFIYGLFLKYKLDPESYLIDLESGEIKGKTNESK
jgi:exo-beta-1,3-glucanase (GH17 family)